MSSSPRKVAVPCVFKVVAPARDKVLCENPAEYSAEFVLPDGRSFFLEFCSAHLPKASALAENWVGEIFCESGLHISCAQFHEIKPGYVPRSEEFLIRLGERKNPKKMRGNKAQLLSFLRNAPSPME
jgi:hypothetical protein